MITPDEISRLRKLCDEATPGPWIAVENSMFGSEWSVTTEAREADNWAEICGIDTEFTDPFGGEQKANAELITTCRTTIPALLDEIERQRKYIDDMVRIAAENKRPAYDEQQRVIMGLQSRNAELTSASDEMLKQIWRLSQSRAELTEALQAYYDQHGCGCGQPACKSCERDRMAQKALECEQ